MEACLVWHTPSPKKLVREQGCVCNSAEEVHPPFRTVRSPIINIEEPEWNAHVRDPRLRYWVSRRVRGQAVDQRVRDEEMVERRALSNQAEQSVRIVTRREASGNLPVP